ncbi:short chain dehydrogenase [Longimycelium tulufanense]|uniref:Short chain dehydrogenase n=1 Tax=Longimycelium tulufanense TaxID=907463 RepID=A0A8J3CC76_9PSEU|nr:SDR family oxidoreductase [Longimycelium tulufanense]GGM72752.1 short chain dehydrogenase [Longimycelium tulufanense]
MTTYFVTGATGFLGRRLVARLLARPECERVYVLVRPGSRGRLARLARDWPTDAYTEVVGDLTEPGLGLTPEQRDTLSGVDHVVHLGALYDLTTGQDVNSRVNVDGTRHVVDLATTVRAGCLHHVSSVAVAGDHPGRFTERDFDLGQHLPSPYHATKFAAERIVRERGGVPWRVYRPSAVVGDSRTGEMDKIDGPYYFFPIVAQLARLGPIPRLTNRLPLVFPEIGATNIVPVDYVVEAMEHLIHAEHPSGSTFHLVNPEPQPLTEVYDAMARAAGAPRVRPTPRWISRAATGIARALARPVRAVTRLVDRRFPLGPRARRGVLTGMGIPVEVLPHLGFASTFDDTAARSALAGTGLRVPPFDEYVGVLWRYWAQNLNPNRFRRQHPDGPLVGRRVVITGASSGIGKATALAVAREGAIPLLVARRTEQLDQVRAEIEAEGGVAYTYPCDLTDGESVDALVKRLLAEHDGIDMLVNNAGRSIRRSLKLSRDRFHDFERTMAINYFAPVRLTLALMPHMARRRFGHVVNVTTQGTEVGSPRFTAYLASKAALEMFARVAAAELLGNGVTFTNVHMPLVRTPMSAPTRIYDAFPAHTPEEAAELVVRGLVKRPKRVRLLTGRLAQAAYAVAPRLMDFVLYLAFRALPESARPTGRPKRE